MAKNLKYIKDRIIELTYRKLNKGEPWLTQEAIKIIDKHLSKNHLMLEMGSGYSTIWFAKRCKQITSVENIQDWHKIIDDEISKQGLTNVNYVFAKENEKSPSDSDYVKVMDGFGSESLDVVLVDGWHRVECASLSLEKLKSGGLLIVDNINWYVPNGSNAPSSLLNKADQLPEWKEFEKQVADYKRVWTDNGVSCTAFYYKP